MVSSHEEEGVEDGGGDDGGEEGGGGEDVGGGSDGGDGGVGLCGGEGWDSLEVALSISQQFGFTSSLPCSFGRWRGGRR